MCCGVSGDLLLKNESVLNIRRVLRHLVIHSDSCGCLSSGVKSRLLYHGNAPAHTSLVVRNFFANQHLIRQKTILKSAYQKCFEDWKKRCHKFIISEGVTLKGTI